MEIGQENDGHEITRLLNEWKKGDQQVREKLFDLIYPTLLKVTGRLLSDKGRDLSMQTTEILHETFVKLVDQRKGKWENRAHFFAVSARLIRRIIVDHARRAGRQKRGGQATQVPLDRTMEISHEGARDWLALDQALAKLATIDLLAARLVELSYFGGLTHEEIASELNISRATVGRHWRFALAWLKKYLYENKKPKPGQS